MTNLKLSICRAAYRAGALSLQAVALALALGAGPARADELGAFPDPEPAEQLERAFWDCERAAVAGMSLDDGLICAEITEEFKRVRFGGDFDTLLAYWRDRKPAEVAELASVVEEVVIEEVAVEEMAIEGVAIEVAGSDMVP